MSKAIYQGLFKDCIFYADTLNRIEDYDATAKDVIGLKEGTVTNATLTTNRFGMTDRAYDFNGTTAYIDTNFASATLGSGDYTISFWFKADSITAGEKLFNDWATSRSLLIQFNTGVIQHYVGTGAATITEHNEVSFSDTSSWHHLVATHDVSTKTLTLCIDNGTPDSDVYTGTRGTSTNDFYLGTRPTVDGDWFDGQMSEIMIWNRTLTSDDCTALYSLTKKKILYPYMRGTTQR